MSTKKRPAKRVREDSSAEEPIIRSPNYWFDDGSIILQAETTQFRVAKSLLAIHSTVFRDMFSVPLPADEPLIEGCPVVALPGDKAADWTHLLDAMYPKQSFPETSPTFEALAAVLRLGKKYDLPSFRAPCLARIRAELPTDCTTFMESADWTRITFPASTSALKANTDFANLARDVGLYSILPSAFYNITIGWNDSNKRSNFLMLSHDLDNLLPTDQTICLNAYAKMVNSHHKAPAKWMRPNHGIPCEDCTDAAACTGARNAILAAQAPDIAIGFFYDWMSIWETGLCAPCISAAKEIFTSTQKECWDVLPSYFGLPSWEELREMDFDHAKQRSRYFHGFQQSRRFQASQTATWELQSLCEAQSAMTTTGGICTNCRLAKQDCTYTRRAPTAKGSIRNLKSAKEHVSRILAQNPPFAPLEDVETLNGMLVELAHYARTLEDYVATLQSRLLLGNSNAHAPPSTTSEEGPPTALQKDFEIQRSSRSLQFVNAAMRHLPPSSRPMIDLPWKRPEMWTRRPWEALVAEIPTPVQIFPEEDLLTALVDVYFLKVNILLSILHEPTFREAVFKDRLHLKDAHFGAVVLCLCAVSSRHCDDPRVLVDGTTDEHSCGWRFFTQIRPMLAICWGGHPANLYQLQIAALAVQFLSGSSMGTRDESWMIAGIGLRVAEVAAVNKRTGSGYASGKLSNLDAELYRRSIWLLTIYDTVVGSYQGRKERIRKLDLDPPEDCDDEYLGTGQGQPVRKPSRSSFILAYITLLKIFCETQEIVYGGNASDDDIIMLDSKLNAWVDELPDHLKWNTNLGNPVFLDQSAALYISYYHAQIVLHRFFIDPERTTAPIETHKPNFPSLAICVTAARSLVHVVRVQAESGNGLLALPNLSTILFDASMISFVNAIAGKKIKTQAEFVKVTADSHACLSVARMYEKRWRAAARRCDAIIAGLKLIKFALLANSNLTWKETETATVAVAAPAPTNPPQDSDRQPTPPEETSTSHTAASPPVATEYLSFAPGGGYPVNQQLPVSPGSGLSFMLPLHTAELGSYVPPIEGLPMGVDLGAHAPEEFQQWQDEQLLEQFAPALQYAGQPSQMEYSQDSDAALFGFDLCGTVPQPGTVDAWDERFSDYGWGDWSAYLMSSQPYS
ncbi:hypothetical protein MKEN_01403700 [Mycena kentingensis (nom. inval.)]|nr:hypothetical protein MKEN_01403700 [Mycena kentingensis (nom. inval.)]